MTARWRRWLGGTHSEVVTAPLLDRHEIAQVLAHGRRLDPLADAPASEFAAGDIPTRRAGSGMEFDDSRPYAHGDDARHINWRLTARTGTTYVKVYLEERRPCGFILLDRRAAMRFATAGRLKVTQAAITALRFAAAAVQRGAPVGALVLDPGAHWLEPRHGEAGSRAVIDAAAAPAPPLDQIDEPTLAGTLSHLNARLRPGCDVLLLSDFADLDEACLPHLVRLAAEHRVRAVQCSDPAETDLPDAGLLELAAARGGEAVTVDSHQAPLRSGFRTLAQRQSQQLTAWLNGTGIRCQRLATVDDALSLALWGP